MVQALNCLKEFASQTAGPYVHIALAPAAAGVDIYVQELGHDIAGPNAKGARITVTDGTGAPVKDVLIEVWQANADAVYPDKNTGTRQVEDGFRGSGCAIRDFETGRFFFKSEKPGTVMGRNRQPMAPHLNLWLVARRINNGLNTRMYFGDEGDANAADPVLGLIGQAHCRDRLIARTEGDTNHFDIRLQGDGETDFLDV